MKGYDTVEYARSRLVDTVIRLEDKPVLVMSVDSDGKGGIAIYYRELLDDDGTVKSEAMEKFNFDPVPLGYVNYGKTSTYISRMPMRKDWRQGMRSVNIVDVGGAMVSHIPYRVIANTIMGKFPSLNSSLEALTKKAKPVLRQAFSRDFAVSNEGALFYKDRFNVGDVNMDNGQIKLNDKFSWVREALEESLVN